MEKARSVISSEPKSTINIFEIVFNDRSPGDHMLDFEKFFSGGLLGEKFRYLHMKSFNAEFQKKCYEGIRIWSIFPGMFRIVQRSTNSYKVRCLIFEDHNTENKIFVCGHLSVSIRTMMGSEKLHGRGKTSDHYPVYAILPSSILINTCMRAIIIY